MMGTLNPEISQEGKEAHSCMMREDGGFKAHTARLGRVRSTMLLQHRRLKGERKNKARKETRTPCLSFVSSSKKEELKDLKQGVSRPMLFCRKINPRSK